MKICHVVSADPYKYLGGTPIVVKCLREHMDSDYIYCRGKIFIIRSFIYTFFIAIWLMIKRYDVVVVHDPAGYGYTLLPKFMRHSKTIAMCQGIWTDFEKMIELNRLQKIKLWFAIRMQRRMINQCDYVMAYCNYVKKRLIGDYGTDVKKIGIVNNGVDTKEFRPIGPHRKNIAIWVCDNPKIRQLDRVIDYVKKNKMKLTVVGVSGTDTENVKYLGKVPHNKMPEIYNQADTFIMFSKITVPPLVLFEAMACGLNIITTDVEIIPVGKDGLCKLDGRSARKLSSRFDWEKVAKRHLDIYEKVLKGELPLR